MLEVILSDFTRLDSEANSSEAQAEEEYKNFMFESARDRALKAGAMANNDAKAMWTSIKEEIRLKVSQINEICPN